MGRFFFKETSCIEKTWKRPFFEYCEMIIMRQRVTYIFFFTFIKDTYMHLPCSWKKSMHSTQLTSYNKNIESTSASNMICTEFAYHIFSNRKDLFFLNSMNLYEIIKMVKNYLTPSLNFSRRKEVVLNLKNWYEFKRNNFVHIILCTFL